jgi:hypothetical protein
MDREAPEPSAAPQEGTSGPGISRRDFATRVGGGGALFGVAWVAAPQIRTLRLAARAAQVGSEPPGTTTTTTTTPGGNPQGTIFLSDHAPCAGNNIVVNASGFVPKTAVTIEIDSPAHTLAVTTADAQGRISRAVALPTSGPLGPHSIVVVGVAAGGKTLTLSSPVNIKDQGNCETPPPSTGPGNGNGNGNGQGTGQGTTGGNPRTGSRRGGGGEEPLAFTGTDPTRLAVIGLGAAAFGRFLLALGRRGSEDEDEDDDLGLAPGRP